MTIEDQVRKVWLEVPVEMQESIDFETGKVVPVYNSLKLEKAVIELCKRFAASQIERIGTPVIEDVPGLFGYVETEEKKLARELTQQLIDGFNERKQAILQELQ